MVENTAARGRCGSRNRKLRAHILNHTSTKNRDQLEVRGFFKFPKPTCSDMLPSANPYCYFVNLLQTKPPSGKQVVKYISLWGTFFSKYSIPFAFMKP